MITQARIIEWYTHYSGQVYISFSGGKDSTVLLYIARQCFPDIRAVFVNTGLEYPEIRQFALAHENVEELAPVWGRAGRKYGKKPTDPITFVDTVRIYGYPIISKEVSNVIDQSRRSPGCSRWQRLQGEYKSKDGKKSMFDQSKYISLFDLPFKISDRCCQVSKKGPAHIYQRKTGRHPIVATTTEESLMRKQSWLITGCNAFSAKDPISKPMSFWREQDILRFIRNEHLPICSVYGDVVSVDSDGLQYHNDWGNNHLICTGCHRTGCMYCAFGFHLEKGITRFQRLKATHPVQYEYCLGGGAFQPNPQYDPSITDTRIWNPKEIWAPTQSGLGMAKVFDWCNSIYGKDFMRYE